MGPVAINPADAVTFANALHGHYSGLNNLELDIARALDRTQRVWCRNPEGSGYFIPLLDRGSTATFWPDFLVWIDRTVVAIDTKGDHLLSEDSRRKLFDIDSTGESERGSLYASYLQGNGTSPKRVRSEGAVPMAIPSGDGARDVCKRSEPMMRGWPSKPH